MSYKEQDEYVFRDLKGHMYVKRFPDGFSVNSYLLHEANCKLFVELRLLNQWI